MWITAVGQADRFVMSDELTEPGGGPPLEFGDRRWHGKSRNAAEQAQSQGVVGAAGQFRRTGVAETVLDC
jgi:hypothetical protein